MRYKIRPDAKLLKITSILVTIHGIAAILATFALSTFLVRNYDIRGGFDGMNLLFFPFFLLIIAGLAILSVGSAIFVVIVGVLGFNYTREPTPRMHTVLIVLASINMVVIHVSGVIGALMLTNGSSLFSVLNVLSFVLSTLFLAGAIDTNARQV